MAIEETDRLGLPTYTSGTDAHPIREDFNTRMQLLDQLAAIVEEGPHEDRGLPQTWGRFWLSTDTRDLYFDRGNEWVLVARIGAGGPGADVVVDGSPSEGTSDRAARADHTHNLPLATDSTPGAMSAADKSKLDAATHNATPDKVLKRDSGGRFFILSPNSGAHPANKTYVDNQVDTRAEVSHTHDADDVTSGTLSPDRLPEATQSERGAMSTADKSKLDGATPASDPGHIVARDAEGRFTIPNPIGPAHVARKGYVDNEVATVTGRLDSIPESEGAISSGDLNDLDPGVYLIVSSNLESVANTPPTSWSIQVMHIQGSSTSYAIQEAWETRSSSDSKFWKRNKNGTTWGPWREVQLVLPQ
ncbi:pyocin knob domain-containing protein [Nesterenkonia suensis]